MKFLEQMTLLYAEDEIITQTLYTKYFKSYFKTVYTAENGQQAIEIYKNKKPDVVILDINMPLLSGLEVSKKIRKKDQHTKIILLTSRIDKEAFLEAVELGLTTYLEKPVTKERLIYSLNKLFDDDYKTESSILWHHNEQVFSWYFLNRELLCNRQIVHLTKKEKFLLELLVNSRHEKVTYQKIYEALWYDDNHKEFSEASIKTLINGLRSKLPPKAIKNVYGLGYFLKRT
ncbi:MAG: response regulator transcription factor [Pseudomonadota bacterium]